MSGSQAAKFSEALQGLNVYSVFEAPGDMAEPKREPDVVLFCSDILGRRYRFPIIDVFPGTPSPAVNHSIPREQWEPFPPDIYEAGTKDAPTWTRELLLWSY